MPHQVPHWAIPQELRLGSARLFGRLCRRGRGGERRKQRDAINCKRGPVFICGVAFEGGECSASHMKHMLEGHRDWEAAGYPVEPYQP
ncbi:MAG: hypothetical protein HOP32_01930 [Nitrospira sp.]|nr:hypothetical protein [Nitrospira sp.]